MGRGVCAGRNPLALAGSEGDGAVLRVSLPALGPGRYKVTWRVLSVDTHVTDGDFTFEVAR